MNFFKPLISFDFWFNLQPPALTRSIFIALGIFLALFLAAGIGVKVWAHCVRKNPPLHRILSRIGRATVVLALIGAVLYFTTYEEVYIFSARFWWLVPLVTGIVWTVFIVLDILKQYPVEMRLRTDRLEREKYLPR